MILADADSGNHEAAVFLRVFAGGQADDFVSVNGSDAGFIQLQILAVPDELVKLVRRCSVVHLVIGEAFAHRSGGGEHSKDLIDMRFIQIVKEDQAVVLPCFLVYVGIEGGKQ